MSGTAATISAKDFDQPGSKESNPATFRYHLTEFLTRRGHSTARVEILTRFIDVYMPKHNNMKLFASVFAMLIINTVQETRPNLFDPTDYDLSKAEGMFRPYILSIMPQREKLSKGDDATYAMYVVTFPRILLEYSQHVADYELLLETVGYQT